MRAVDPVQDLDMAARRRIDDCRNRQQWNAFPAIILSRRRPCPRTCAHHLLGHVRALHKLAAYQIQAEAS